MFTLGRRPRGNPSAVWALSTITTDAINRKPPRMATGAPAAPTPTDHSTANPGGGASKKKHGGRNWQLFKQHDRPNSTRKQNPGIDQKQHRGYAHDFDSCCCCCSHELIATTMQSVVTKSAQALGMNLRKTIFKKSK